MSRLLLCTAVYGVTVIASASKLMKMLLGQVVSRLMMKTCMCLMKPGIVLEEGAGEGGRRVE